MRSTVKSDGPATVLYSISNFYDVFGTAIRAFTKRLVSSARSLRAVVVLHRIWYFYDLFGTAIRAFTRRLARSRTIFDGGRNVFGWWCAKTYKAHHWHGAICLGKKSAFSFRAYGDSAATFAQRNTGLRGEKWTRGVPVKSLTLGCDGAQQRERFLSVPMGTLRQSLHNGIQASGGKNGYGAFL